jgi:hypothetical protein
MRKTKITLFVAVSTLLLSSGVRAQRKSAAELKTEIAEVERRIDKALLRLFKDQIEAAVFRSRVSALQKEWQRLFAELGIKPKLAAPKPPQPNRFRIAEVAASDAGSFESAIVTPSCKRRRGCRLWVRIAFGRALVAKRVKFELSADLQQSKSSKKYTVPTRELTVTKPLMVVDLKLESLYLRKGAYTGRLKVLCDGRYKSRPFELQLHGTY